MATIDLSTLAFFDGFDEESLARVQAMGEPVTADPNAVITQQGDVGREAFLVCSGELQVQVSGQTVATVGAGTILGEMALVDLRPRSATVVALTECELLSFDAKAFRKIIDEMPPEARQRLAARNDRFRVEHAEVSDDGRPRRIKG